MNQKQLNPGTSGFVPPTGDLPQVPVPGHKAVTFGQDKSFQKELQKRVDAYFETSGKPRRDSPWMYFKAGFFLLSFFSAYILLVFYVTNLWVALPLAVLIGLSTAGIGFNIMHDAGHGSLSRHGWVNNLMARSLDMIGGCAYLWHWKHGIFHHTWVNITGHDVDVEMNNLGRLTPHQPRLFFHRYQHWYIWFLYGLMAIKWQLLDDFRDLISGHIGPHRIKRPQGWSLLGIIAGKVVFFSLAFGIPLLFHPVIHVISFYLLISTVLGMVMGVVFQLAHCVEEADFQLPDSKTGRMEKGWAEHQVQTTVNFCRNNPLITFFLGGLNFQVEHHLFPKISHVNYPALSRVVRETCQEYGIPYHEHRTFLAGMASHFRWLRKMGQPTPAV